MTVTRERLSVPTTRPSPVAPVLVVARVPDDAGLADLREACGTFGWTAIEHIGDERLAWSASVHRPSAVLLSAADPAWTERAVATVRGSTSRPLVVVGGMDSADVLALIRAGADAVLPPGLSEEELLARTYAVIRRSTEQLGPGTRYLAAGPLRVDLWQRSVRRGSTVVRLTSTEFDLLSLLMRNAEGTLDAGAILLRVWGRSAGPDGLNTLRICVGRLRAKLGDDARHSTIIASVRGHGYKFALPVLEVPDEDRINLAAAGEQSDHIDAIVEVAEQLAAQSDERGLAAALVEAVLERGLADGAGVHRVDGQLLRLVAHRGLSDEWVSRVSPGVGPGDGYASVQAVWTATPVHLTKPSARHHRGTNWLLQSEKPLSCLFVPIGRGGRIEGCLGVIRRTATPYGPTAVAVLRALCSIYAAELAARRLLGE